MQNKSLTFSEHYIKIFSALTYAWKQLGISKKKDGYNHSENKKDVIKAREHGVRREYL